MSDHADVIREAFLGLATEEDALAALDAIQDKFDHLHSEYSYDRPRGDHLVYRDEWEAFDAWQRSGDRMEEESYAWQHRAEAAEARVTMLEAALREIANNVGFGDYVACACITDPTGPKRTCICANEFRRIARAALKETL